MDEVKPDETCVVAYVTIKVPLPYKKLALIEVQTDHQESLFNEVVSPGPLYRPTLGTRTGP